MLPSPKGCGPRERGGSCNKEATSPGRGGVESRLFSRVAGLASTSSWLAAARVAGAFAGFVTQIVLARALPAEALGLFYSVTSLAAVVGLVAAHGYPAIASRFLSRYREQGKSGLVAGFVARARRQAAAYAIVAALGVLAFALLWPSFSVEARLAVGAAALSIPANASLRLNGSLAAAIRKFALAYLPDTSIRPFLLLGGIMLLIACGHTLSASGVTLLLGGVLAVLAVSQYALLRRELPMEAAASMPRRLVQRWQREAMPLIVVALFTYFFADVDILIATPLLSGAETAALGLCLKLALLVGFAVQVAHQLVVPDLADARARKDAAPIRGVLTRALAFPLAVTLLATVVAVFWGGQLLAVFSPEFVAAKPALVILIACQLIRALFGPSVPLLTVIGAQRQNAALAIAALVVLVISNIALAPLYGVTGAAVAVAVATLCWLVGSALLLGRLSGLRTDVLHLLGRTLAADQISKIRA